MDRPTAATARRNKDIALAIRVIGQPDPAVIMAAWRRFGRPVYWILTRMLGPVEEVRDLRQETFLQFYRSVHAIRSPEAMRQFVAGIAARLALGELKRRRVRGNQVLLPGQGPVPLPSNSANPEARQAVTRLHDLVGRLRDADQELFLLRQIDGLEQTEISALTRQSLSTVRRRLYRLQRRLDSLLRAEPALSAYAGAFSRPQPTTRRRRRDASPRP